MTEQAKAEQLCSPECESDATCYPLRKWQPGWPFYQDFGLQPVVELGNLPWVDGLQRRWPGCSPWLGYAPSPLFVPYVMRSLQHSSPNASMEQFKWRVILDMIHFAPSEISVSVQEGFLVIGGSHSERPDVYGFTARCFTRKYRLPVGVDVSKLTSTMSDGFLSVEAPLPDTAIPADIVIPIQVEKETIGGEEMQEDHKEAAPETHTEHEPEQSEPTAPEQPPAEPEPEPSTEAPDQGEDSPLAGEDKQEEAQEAAQEAEVDDTPSGEPHPLAPADEEGTERFSEPSEHSDALDGRDNTEPAASMEQQIEEPGKEEIPETADTESRETQPTAPVLSDQPAAAADHAEVSPQEVHSEEQQIEEPGKEEIPETADTESRETQPTAPVLSDQPAAAADHAEVSPPEVQGEEAADPDSAAGDLQEHEEGTEKDVEAHTEPTAEPHPLTPASDEGAAESLPEPPPEHHEALDSQDSPGSTAASAEPAHDGEIQPKEEATEEITQQHEEPELVKGLPTDGQSQEPLELEVPDVKE